MCGSSLFLSISVPLISFTIIAYAQLPLKLCLIAHDELKNDSVVFFTLSSAVCFSYLKKVKSDIHNQSSTLLLNPSFGTHILDTLVYYKLWVKELKHKLQSIDRENFDSADLICQICQNFCPIELLYYSIQYIVCL